MAPHYAAVMVFAAAAPAAAAAAAAAAATAAAAAAANPRVHCTQTAAILPGDTRMKIPQRGCGQRCVASAPA